MAKRQKKYHIAIPQLYSDYVRTLCKPEKGYPRHNCNSYTDIAYTLPLGVVCKTCEKLVSDINTRTWNETMRDVQIESKKQFESRMKNRANTPIYNAYQYIGASVYTPVTWMNYNVVSI